MRHVHATTVWLLAALLAAALVFVACADDGAEDPVDGASPSPTAEATPTAEPAAGGFPVTVTDTNGNEITFEQAPQAVAALAPAFVEIICAVGACDSLVLVDENSDFPPEVADIPKVSGFQPSVEGVATAQPDLVVISFDPGGLQDSLEAAGIPVLFLDAPATLEGVYGQIELFGDVMGNPDAADDVVADMRARVDEITAQLPEGEAPRVYHELDATFFSAGPGSFIADLYDILGAHNIAEATGEPFPQLSAEAIIDADPEVIILADEGLGESAETVAARPGWDAISAVQDDRIHGIDPDLISRPGPRIVDALEELARLIYPEVFA